MTKAIDAAIDGLVWLAVEGFVLLVRAIPLIVAVLMALWLARYLHLL